MDAEHDLPAHAEDLDAAFAEAVANAGPHDQAEPYPAADLPLRQPASAPATVDPPLVKAADDSVPDPVHVAAVDQRESPGGSEQIPPAVVEGQLAVVDTRASRSQAWIGQVAGVSVAAVGGAAIVLTMLVPSMRGRESGPVDRPVAAADDSRPHAAVVESQPAAVQKPVPALAPVPGWRVTDEWTGGRKKSLAYELAAERPVRLWMRQATPVLVVRCLSGTLDAFVVTGSASAIEPGRADHTVQLAFDDGQSESQHWTDSADHDGLFAPNGAAVFSRFASAHTLRFGFTPHNAPPVEAVFAVDGAGTLASTLGKHCH